MTTSRLASEIARKKERDTDRKAVALELATDKAAKLKFKDRGTSGDKELQKIETASYKKKSKSHLDSYKKRNEDEANVTLYGKDAMKGKGFATTGRPKSINAGASRPATQSGTPKGK
jgi:hypothetical protein